MAQWLIALIRKPANWRDYSIFRQPYDEFLMERENRDLVANFMAHHGWWGGTIDDEIANFIDWEEYQDCI